MLFLLPLRWLFLIFTFNKNFSFVHFREKSKKKQTNDCYANSHGKMHCNYWNQWPGLISFCRFFFWWFWWIGCLFYFCLSFYFGFQVFDKQCSRERETKALEREFCFRSVKGKQKPDNGICIIKVSHW